MKNLERAFFGFMGGVLTISGIILGLSGNIPLSVFSIVIGLFSFYVAAK
ncbi:MAG: hypothetical protein ABIF85_05995 [Nanoarchaeota archaeon]|nr:hypothetical protein [Nanoarchaeota archaeon]